MIEKGFQNESFCDAKIAKSAGRYCKSSVLRVQEQYQNLIENGTQNDTQKHPKWSHWRPWGGQWATLSPALVDSEGSENRSIFKAPQVAKKLMDVRLGAVRGVIFFPGGSAAARRRGPF